MDYLTNYFETIKNMEMFKVLNRRTLTKEEIIAIIKKNNIKFFDRKKIIRVGQSGLKLEMLEKAFPDSTEKLTQEQIEFINLSFQTAYDDIMSNWNFLTDGLDDISTPDSLQSEAENIAPQINRLLDFMEERGLLTEEQAKIRNMYPMIMERSRGNNL